MFVVLLLGLLFKTIQAQQTNDCSNDKTKFESSVVMRLQETSVSFLCDICLPDVLELDRIIEWLFNSTQNSTFVNIPVESFENSVIGANRNLNLHNLQMEHSGKYWCEYNETLRSTLHFLHVDNGSEPIRIVHPNDTLQVDVVLPNYNLKIYSDLTPWSSCSKCDQVGERIRYGYCTITSTRIRSRENRGATFQEHVDYDNVFDADYYYDEAVDERDDGMIDNTLLNEIRNDILDINYAVTVVLPKFQNKLPCRSRYTPLVLQHLPGVEGRSSEIIKEICRIKCPKNVIFNIQDKSGRILETANNSAGIYAMIQGIPEAVPMPVRATLYKEFNTPCELKCPGLRSDTPVTWKIGLQNLELTTSTQDRVHANERGHIIFNKLRFSDSNIYSCWQENKVSGTIRLKVTKDTQIKFNRYVMMIGAIIILSVYLLVFWKAFRGRKRFTKR